MGRFILAVAAVIIFGATPIPHSGAGAWDNPDSRAVPFKTVVPKETASVVTLDASRVKSINGNTITYNMGKGPDITIRADSFAAKRFIKDVERGRTSARETVRIEPIRKSPFNTQYKTTR